MATISFKSDDDFKYKIETLAKKKGINTSAYIKLILTHAVNGELVEITENGLTVAEEISILESEKGGPISGPFKSSKALLNALKR